MKPCKSIDAEPENIMGLIIDPNLKFPAVKFPGLHSIKMHSAIKKKYFNLALTTSAN